MSVSAPPPATADPGGGAAPAGTPVDACPLCGAPLHAEQEWCLSCGAAARTRLAAAPNWRAPLVTAAIVAALALGVLVAALVKLAADTGPAPAASTRTVTTAAGAVAPLTTTPAPGATAPTTSTPGAAGGNAGATGTPGASGTPGAPATAGTTPTGTAPTGTAPTTTGGVKAGERILPTTIPPVVGRTTPRSNVK